MTDYITIDSPDNLLRYLWNEQGRHLSAMLSVPSWDGADPDWIYTSDDQLDSISSATDLFALLTEFLHFDRDITELYPMLLADRTALGTIYDEAYYTALNNPCYLISNLACDGLASIFDIFPCTNY